MNTRKIIIRAVLVAIGLPVVLVLVAVVSFYVSFYALNRANGTIVSSGQKREYLLYVPRSYDRTKLALELVYRPPTGADDFVSWDSGSDGSVRRRSVGRSV